MSDDVLASGFVPPHTLVERESALRGDLPKGAQEGLYKLGTAIMISREGISERVRNPDLPEWFPAVVVMPPEEPGNWYRWYDPFIWYETEIDLSNGGDWCTAKRNMAYVGNLWCPKYPRPCWAIPTSEFKQPEKDS